MLSQRMQDALNKQINNEAYSGYLYLAMAGYFESLGLKGFSHWMTFQAREEFFHTSKFYGYVIDRGGRVQLAAIEQPPADWTSPLAVFQDTVEHERNVTASINNLVNIAREESDHATEAFLQWFVTEQVEEEASAEDVLQRLKLAGETGPGLFMMNNELAQRALSPLVVAALTGAATAA